MDDVTTQNEPQESGQSAKAPPLPPGAMIILPVRQVVLFPGVVLPLSLGRPASIAAAQEAVRNEQPLGVLLQTISHGPLPRAIAIAGSGFVIVGLMCSAVGAFARRSSDVSIT